MSLLAVNANSSSSRCCSSRPQDSLRSRITSLAQSLICGTQGNYKIAGIPVQFEGQNKITLYNSQKLWTEHLSVIYNVTLLRYLYIFIHEMGHAIVHQFLTKNLSNIIIREGGGLTQFYKNTRDEDTMNNTMDEDIDIMPRNLSEKENLTENIVKAAGPLVSVSFAHLVLLAENNLKKFLPTIPFLMKTISFLMRIGAAYNILYEVLYFLASCIQKDDGFSVMTKVEGDWEAILKKDKTHFALAFLVFFGISISGLKLALSRFK